MSFFSAATHCRSTGRRKGRRARAQSSPQSRRMASATGSTGCAPRRPSSTPEKASERLRSCWETMAVSLLFASVLLCQRGSRATYRAAIFSVRNGTTPCHPNSANGWPSGCHSFGPMNSMG